MDADVRDFVHRADRHQPTCENQVRADPVDCVARRQRCARHRECHGVIAGFARLEMRRVIVVVVMRYGSIVLVCSEPVVVLGMVVVDVQVNVEQRHLARRRGEDQSEQDRCCARHYTTSLCNRARTIKRRRTVSTAR